jgi:hypothetical protein
MSRNRDASNLNRRAFLAVAGSVVATSSIGGEKASSYVHAPIPTGPPAPVNYIVSVDATTYPFSYLDGNGNKVYHLTVAAGSKVAWQAKTSNPNKHCVAILFPKESPIVDTNLRPLYALLWSEMEESSGPNYFSVDPDASGAYEYTVVVFDRQSGTTQRDDPKMIVGSGNQELREQVASARSELQDVHKELLGKANVETQVKEIGTIEAKLTAIIDELK